MSDKNSDAGCAGEGDSSSDFQYVLIGKAQADLDQWAAEIVLNGLVLMGVEIADLWGLVDAIQRHPKACLASEPTDSKATASKNNLDDVTTLEVRHSIIHSLRPTLEKGTPQWPPVRVSLVFHDCQYKGDSNFARTAFRGYFEMHGGKCERGVAFASSTFSAPVLIEMMEFEGGAILSDSTFESHASFIDCRFGHRLVICKAMFGSNLSFAGSNFLRGLSFEDVICVGAFVFGSKTSGAFSSFDRTIFGASVNLAGTIFGDRVSFKQSQFRAGVGCFSTTFVDKADFTSAHLRGGVIFNGAVFAGEATFDKACFEDDFVFDGTVFCQLATFHDALLWGKTFDDLRTATVRGAGAVASGSMGPPQWNGQSGIFKSLVLRWRLARERLTAEWIGWHRVRNLGELQVLNRASLISLFAVPILASVYVSARNVPSAESSVWLYLFRAVIGQNPHLSSSLTWLFFASVAVSLGRLVYQTSAPVAVRRGSEEEFVREVESRYPEGSAQRDDGLRRAIERLEDQARIRFGRNQAFVQHHGDVIWIPCRERLDLFSDESLPTLGDLQAKIHGALHLADMALQDAPQALAPRKREGFVPGAERARICIEEGAKAEYWLLCRTNLKRAWLSLGLYLAGVLFLLLILGLQCLNVGRAWVGL